MITVLGRGTSPGLEVETRTAATATPCCSRAVAYDDAIGAEDHGKGHGGGEDDGKEHGGGEGESDTRGGTDATAFVLRATAVRGGGGDAINADLPLHSPALARTATPESAAAAMWQILEPIMTDAQVVVMVGESLARASGGRLPACLHRVTQPPGSAARINMAFELRPAFAVFAAVNACQTGEDVRAGAE
jgi:hypothetical protein